MNVYLAGKWADRHGHLAEKLKSLQEAGHTITHNWMTFEVPTKDHKHMGIMAFKDIQGVCDADAVVLVMDDKTYTYRGTFSELGAALATKKRTCIVSPPGEDYAFKSNVFWHHPAINHVRTWEKALAWLGK